MRTRTIGVVAMALTLVPFSARPAAAAHDHDAALPPQQVGGHYHEGELGEAYLELERSFKCSCGCGLDVHSCQFQMQCDTSPAWSARIRQDLEAGQTPETITASFVADFGPSVLMAPPAEGFNLVGYLLPGMAIVMAGVLVGLIARGGATRPQLAPIEQPTDEQAERLRAAMKVLEESESPDW